MIRIFRIRNDIFRAYAVVMIGIDDTDNKTVFVRLERGEDFTYACRSSSAALRLLEKTQNAWMDSLR